MLAKNNVWLLFFLSGLFYVLYSDSYVKSIKEYIKNYYFGIGNLYKSGLSVKPDIPLEELLFTPSELKKYVTLTNGLYLSILGQVFDVSSGAKHYGPGSSYHEFTGRDASAAFITGDFSENGLTDDVSTLSDKQLQSLMTWIEFYRKTYIYKGNLIGRYYNSDGSLTNERYILEERIQTAKKRDFDKEKENDKFPPCNIEYDVNYGSRVWCTKNSGGVTRNWIGVPRMLFDDPSSKNHRCACVDVQSSDYKDNKGIIRAYQNCDEASTTCNIISD